MREGGIVDTFLNRHADRRRQGLATVSVMSGGAGATWLVWRRWAEGAGLRPVLHVWDDPPALAAVLFADLEQLYDLRGLALGHLCAMAGLAGTGDGAMRSGRDVEQLIGAALSRDQSAATRVSSALVRFDGHPSKLLEQLDGEFAGGVGRPGWRVLQAMDGLLPAEGRMAPLLVARDSAGEGIGWIVRVASAVAELAEALPGWTVGVCAPAIAFGRFSAEQAPSKAKSLLVAGLIPMGVLGVGAVEDRLGGADRLRRENLLRGENWLCGAALEPIEIERAIRVLESVGATPELAESFTTAATLRPERDELARSAAERFLFELLESHPRTRGRFVLNGDPGFMFGLRAAEIDLLASGLLLAVEVDGYYHFTDADAYRRDRRKDWELQRHGYTIVRVLAEDVVARMDEVLDAILAAVNYCVERSKGKQPIAGEGNRP